MKTDAIDRGAGDGPGLKTVVVASAAGTAFEWYDFFVFGSLTTIIARHFFADAGDGVAGGGGQGGRGGHEDEQLTHG